MAVALTLARAFLPPAFLALALAVPLLLPEPVDLRLEAVVLLLQVRFVRLPLVVGPLAPLVQILLVWVGDVSMSS